MIYLRTWLFGERAPDHLDALTALHGYPRARHWLPLDVTVEDEFDSLRRWRSAWAARFDETGEQWLEVALPAAMVRAELGPHALVGGATGLTRTSVHRSNVSKESGQWMVKVPRFFTTVTESWTGHVDDRKPLVALDGRTADQMTVGELDVEGSLDRHRDEPDLVIGPDGPVVFAAFDLKYRSTRRWHDRLDAGVAELMKLPPETPVVNAWCRL
jgi:hypothetical protein